MAESGLADALGQPSRREGGRLATPATIYDAMALCLMRLRIC